MSDLNVDLYGLNVGQLVGSDRRKFDFVANPDAVERIGLAGRLLSVSVPLETRRITARAARRRNFFAELLPEGRQLENLASAVRVSSSDVIGLLRHYGRDVAGALQIYDPEFPSPPRMPSVKPLTESALGSLLRNPLAQPLGNLPLFGRTSLAGVQEKIAAVRLGESWGQAIDGYPSTHILKPAPTQFPSMIYDEEYGHRISNALGLSSYAAEIGTFDGTDALVIERYDRAANDVSSRIHQEDFNQVLGASGNEKYQEMGGKVSLARVAKALTTHCGRPDLDRLFRQVTAALAMGNLDLHTKNLGLLHPETEPMTLAPAYDMVPLGHLDTNGRMALAINGKYAYSQISFSDLVSEGESWGLDNASELARICLNEILEVIESEVPHASAYVGLRQNIGSNVRALLG